MMITGIILLISGVFVYSNNKSNPAGELVSIDVGEKSNPVDEKSKSIEKNESKKKGDDFEKFIVKKFNPDYFKIKQ